MRRWLLPLLLLALVAAVVVGLTQAGSRSPARATEARFDLDAALRRLQGAPAPLAGLHRQAAQVLEGGEPAFRKRLRALRGRPVVVNVWASWCGPCRHEFPVFQRVATDRGRDVAFLGVATQDARKPAEAFLREEPVPYPSYLDGDGQPIVRGLELPKAVPLTVFLDRDGDVAFTHAGDYASRGELEADVDRYLKP